MLATLLTTVLMAAATTGEQLQDPNVPAAMFAPEIRPTPPPPPPVNPALLKLEQKYDGIKNETCASVLTHVPTLDAADAAAFMTAYQAFLGNTSEAPVIAAAKKLMSPALTAFLSLPDSFTTGGLDAAMVKCALMVGAYRGVGGGPKMLGGAPPAPSHLLALFAFQGAAEEALVDQLLADPMLMRDMLVTGGAMSGHYGEAMAIWHGCSIWTGCCARGCLYYRIQRTCV
jgi:hypothetical protein